MLGCASKARRFRAFLFPYDEDVRRHFRTVALFGLIGVVITVVLAWMFAVLGSLGPPTEWQRDRLQRGRLPPPPAWQDSFLREWPVRVPKEWPEPLVHSVATGRGLHWHSVSGVRQGSTEQRNYRLTVVESGWPFYAMRWQSRIESGGSEAESPSFTNLWIDLPDWVDAQASSWTEGFYARRRLPIEPVWLGFFGDVVLFGGGLWVLLRVRGVVRRYVRWKRGRCLECGYPIGGSAVCTECGGVVAPAARS